MSSYKSRHSGFIDKIRSIFHSRDQCLMFFSRWIAPNTQNPFMFALMDHRVSPLCGGPVMTQEPGTYACFRASVASSQPSQ